MKKLSLLLTLILFSAPIVQPLEAITPQQSKEAPYATRLKESIVSYWQHLKGDKECDLQQVKQVRLGTAFAAAALTCATPLLWKTIQPIQDYLASRKRSLLVQMEQGKYPEFTFSVDDKNQCLIVEIPKGVPLYKKVSKAIADDLKQHNNQNHWWKKIQFNPIEYAIPNEEVTRMIKDVVGEDNVVVNFSNNGCEWYIEAQADKDMSERIYALIRLHRPTRNLVIISPLTKK